MTRRPPEVVDSAFEPRADGSYIVRTSDAVHAMFGLTYASYLVLPRVLLQSMPTQWQRKFVKLLNQFEAAFEHVDYVQRYTVLPRDERNRFTRQTLPHYRHGYVKPKL